MSYLSAVVESYINRRTTEELQCPIHFGQILSHQWNPILLQEWILEGSHVQYRAVPISWFCGTFTFYTLTQVAGLQLISAFPDICVRFFQPQCLFCVQTFPSGREQDDLGGEDANDAADEDDVAAFDADMRQYAEQVHIIFHNSMLRHSHAVPGFQLTKSMHESPPGVMVSVLRCR